tara:strand:+ start:41004 stop:41474 length:471 start_codon:yes stop_codon:yes gene_type:complete
MIIILLMVVTQMGSRMIGVVAPGVDDFAAYSVVAVIFLGLAPALKSGALIRVLLILNALPVRAAWICDVFCHVVAVCLTAYFGYWAINFAYDSYAFGDVATGMIKTPMWIPQSTMGIGLIVFLIALIDDLFATITSTPDNLRARRNNQEIHEAGEL